MASKAPASQLVGCAVAPQRAARITSGLAVASRPDQDRNSRMSQCPIVMSPPRCLCGARLGSGWTELSAIHPHAMQDDPELAGQCHAGLFVAHLGAQLQGPFPQRATTTCAGDQARRGLEQQRSQHAIATAGDPSRVVDFARLVAPRCEADIGAYRPRVGKSGRIVDRRHEGIGCDRANAGHPHEPAAQLRTSRLSQQPPCEFGE